MREFMGGRGGGLKQVGKCRMVGCLLREGRRESVACCCCESCYIESAVDMS